MDIKLSDGIVVTLKEKLKYGDRCKIRVASGVIEDTGKAPKNAKSEVEENPGMLREAMKMIVSNNIEAERVAMECFITRIMKGEEEIECNHEWLDELELDDSELILEKVRPFIEKSIESKKK